MKAEFLISELAEKAEVTVRTIRYYLAEGLLPPPVARGKYAYYSQEHLDQLELIRRLKALHLPLEEIRQILKAASAEDIHKLLIYQDKTSSKSYSRIPRSERDRPGKAALDYISQIASVHSAFREPDFSKFTVSQAVPDKSLKREVKASPIARESWERIQLGPGVELNYMATSDPSVLDQINKLIRFAQNLFKE